MLRGQSGITTSFCILQHLPQPIWGKLLSPWNYLQEHDCLYQGNCTKWVGVCLCSSGDLTPWLQHYNKLPSSCRSMAVTLYPWQTASLQARQPFLKSGNKAILIHLTRRNIHKCKRVPHPILYFHFLPLLIPARTNPMRFGVLFFPPESAGVISPPVLYPEGTEISEAFIKNVLLLNCLWHNAINVLFLLLNQELSLELG